MRMARIFRALALIQDEREACWRRARKYRDGSGDLNDLMKAMVAHEEKKLDAVRNALLACIAPNDTKPTEEESNEAG